MTSTFKLKNGRTFNSDDISCPICGKKMIVDEGTMTCPKSELQFRGRPSPFSGTVIDNLVSCDITMKCPDDCCTFNFTNCEIISCVGELH